MSVVDVIKASQSMRHGFLPVGLAISLSLALLWGCGDDPVPPPEDFGNDVQDLSDLEQDRPDELEQADELEADELSPDLELSELEQDLEEQDEEVADEELEELLEDGLTGQWARLTVMASMAEVPVVGQVSTLTKAIQLVSMQQRGNVVDFEAVVCELWLETESTLIETVFPEVFITSLAPTIQQLEWTGERLVAESLTELRGVRLDNPDTDALPTASDDPRIFDQDGDGKPGMTVRVVGLVDGEIWVIQRAKSSWDAGVMDPSVDSLGGLVEWSDEQVNLGSDNPLLETSPVNYPDPDASKSYFRMQRLSASAGCADAIAMAQDW
ncbi:MAG: hypothetical protein RBU37_11095 [Myxococcota bacterium]|jgi:hypothetical protein|nr:hypothetical protein [Myxococcota bacterium]